MFGGLETDDAFCRRVCEETGAVVFDVDYRLAPEYPFPTPVDDSWTAFEWVSSALENIVFSFTFLFLSLLESNKGQWIYSKTGQN